MTSSDSDAVVEDDTTKPETRPHEQKINRRVPYLLQAAFFIIPILVATWLGAHFALPPQSAGVHAALGALGVPGSGHQDGQTLLHGKYRSAAPTASADAANSLLSKPDTTAVVLNWSRLPNVVMIVSLLCAPWLKDVIAEIVIWNNNPVPISHKDFVKANCLSTRLRIHNSPENLYFQARHLACAGASTPFCFIQDDDYLIQPEIIRTLHARMVEQGEDLHPIFILPPHEHLSSLLRETHTHWSDLHTSFSWLGHGAYVPRVHTVDFLDALKTLNVSEDEMKMADNYFTILRNRVPEIWHDHGIELSGGEPFTVGSEGDERNRRYTTKALQYLDDLGQRKVSKTLGATPQPYFYTGPPQATPFPARAPCLGAVCLLETNIPMLPKQVTQKSNKAIDMLTLESRRRDILGEENTKMYLSHPLSMAVDGKANTSFVSSQNGRKGEWLSLDLLAASSQGVTIGPQKVAMLWLIDTTMEPILDACAFEVSSDGSSWLPVVPDRSCLPVGENISGLERAVECRIELENGDSAGSALRFVRARLMSNLKAKWNVYEIWLGSAA